MIRRFLRWLNWRLNLIEINEEMNAWYDWADQELDKKEKKQ